MAQTNLENAEHAEAALADLLAGFPHIRLRVTGTCMEPCLVPGQTALVAGRQLSPPRWGDVVLVRDPQGLHLHRLVWRGGARFLTKADRSRHLDATWSGGALLGTVVGVEGEATGQRLRRRLRAARSLAGGLLAWCRRQAATRTGGMA